MRLAIARGTVVVTENAGGFATVTDCPVVFVPESWWPSGSLPSRVAGALDRWAQENPEPASSRERVQACRRASATATICFAHLMQLAASESLTSALS